jgi:hypothetical protein
VGAFGRWHHLKMAWPLPDDGYALLCLLLCRSRFLHFRTSLRVHMRGNASFNVLYINDVVWPLRVETQYGVLDTASK